MFILPGIGRSLAQAEPIHRRSMSCLSYLELEGLWPRLNPYTEGACRVYLTWNWKVSGPG